MCHMMYSLHENMCRVTCGISFLTTGVNDLSGLQVSIKSIPIP